MYADVIATIYRGGIIVNNNSSQSRFAKITAKVIVMLLAVVLSLSVLPTLSADILPEARAAENYTVPSGTTAAAITEKLASYPAGTVVDVILQGDVNFTDTSTATFSSGITGITVPSGITVNLFMNGKKIVFSRESGGAWQLPYVYAIHNKGTLNIYSGGTTTGSNTNASIDVVNVRTGMGAGKRELSYANLEAVRNEGTLTVNRGVKINVNSTLHYEIDVGASATTEESAQVSSGATAVYNANNRASCTVNGATITVYALGQGSMSSQCDDGERTSSVTVAYGVYGGNVKVSGSTVMNVTSQGNHHRDTHLGNASDARARITSIAYGIATTGSVELTGGTITHDANINSIDAVTSDGNGQQFLFGGGIYTITGSVPVIPDATINTPAENCMNNTTNATYNKGAVVTSSEMIRSATDIVASGQSYTEYIVVTPSAAVNGGTFRDEAGNTYTSTNTTTANAIPAAINHGAVAGSDRVHIIYRYWADENRKNIDTSIVGSGGTVGYSYSPLVDGTNIVNSLVNLQGVAGTTKLTKDPEATIRYLSGADSSNSYYWELIDIAWTTTASWFSDYNVATSANAGREFKTFDNISPVDESVKQSGPIYIFVDYARKDPTTIKANVGTGNVVNTVYSGAPVSAADIGLKISDAVTNKDYTSEYNLDYTNTKKIAVSFSYTGTNAAGREESIENGQLPTNAGTYQVTLKIAESTTYDKNPSTNKNRLGLEYKFTLIIDQASATRGTLPPDVAPVYGTKLNQALLLTDYHADGIAGETGLTGVFSFKNAADGNEYKNFTQGKAQTVVITWTPRYSDTAVAHNYKATDFNVSYTITQAPLTIKPNPAIVTYGETEFTKAYSVAINGLVANDNTDSVKATISGALIYQIRQGTGYSSYVVGETGAGEYPIRPVFTDEPAVLDNYDWTFIYGENNPGGNLTVNKRAIKVKAAATERAYDPTDDTAVVTFSVDEGAYSSQSITFKSAIGDLLDNSAGVQQVWNINADDAVINGVAANNYYIEALTYNTGDKLFVTIKKAVPTTGTPVVEEMFYQNGRTLGDIDISSTTASVPGEWSWVNKTVNPTVNTTVYQAQFVPTDKNNYETKVIDVNVKIKTTPVVISYTGTVSYGDNIPNITAYTYKTDLDPTFDIESVVTSGNITPRTDYVKGSPVKEGGYAVTISAPNFVDVNNNYSFTTADGVINVNPRLITFKVEDTSAVYGDNFVPSASTVNVTLDESLLVGTDTITDVTSTGLEPTFTFSTDFRYIDNYQVGSYYIKATPNFETSPNYAVATTDGILKITKAQLVIKADDITLEYGSEIPADIENAYTVVGAKRNETAKDVLSAGTIKIDTTYEKNAPVNAEGYPVTVDITDAVFNNYTVSVQHGTVTVIKATPRVLVLPTATIVHGETLGDAVFTGGSIENNVPGKYLYNAATTTPAYRTEAYTIYTATFVPTDSVNYNSVTGLYIALTVNKKSVAGSLSVTGIPMVGEKLTVDVTGLDPDELGVYSITWFNAAGTQIGTGAELNLVDAHKLQTLTVKAVANAPYTGEVTYVTTTIAPSLTSVETILTADKYNTYFNLQGLSEYQGDAEYTYNAQPHYIEFQRENNSLSSAAIGNVTVKYNGSTVAPTKVGYYTVTIDIATPADVDLTQVQFVNGVSMVGDKVVYSPVANFKIGTLVITQAPYYVNVEVLDKIYDGTGSAVAEVKDEYGACELTGGASDDVSFDADEAVYYFASSNVGTDIDVFVNNAILKGAAADNYELFISLANDGKADISKRTLKVKVVPVEREYEEGNYYVDLSFEPVANTLAAGDDGFVYVDEALVQGAIDNYRAGLRNVTVSGAVLTGAKAGNYNLEITNLDGLTVEILKATPFYPIPMTDVLYYDSARPLNEISLGDSRWAWDNEVANEVPGAGIHTYKAIYTPDDTKNYAVVEYDVDVEILKTTVTITAANFSVIYGDIEPTYYYTVTGLTGADTIKDSVDGYVLMNCSYQAGSNVGTYNIVLTGAFESDNYDFIYKNGTVTVNKRAAYIEAIAENREYQPGNLYVDVTFSEISNLYGSDAKSVFLSNNKVSGTIDNENAGIKNVKYDMPELMGEKALNYDLRLLNTTLNVEILKAKFSGVVLPASGTVGYGQKLSTVKYTSDYSGLEYGTFTMENPTLTPTEVGTFGDVYKVVFTPFNTQNYATITQYITLTVVPSELNLYISLTGTLQSGKTLYVVTSELPVGAEDYLYYRWYRVDSPDEDPRNGILVGSGKDDFYTLTEGDSGKYIICTVTNSDNAPYTCYAQSATDSPIEEQQLTFWQKLVNWFYRLISNFTQIFGKLM